MKMLNASGISVQTKIPCGFASVLERYICHILLISVLTVKGAGLKLVEFGTHK
jgi:hypothetical protein